jgi:UDP:flavonoid glycosyltransferase YjiC (YdhE family)
MSDKRILFIAEAVTLAHISRSVALADGLYHTGKYTVCLAADSRFDQLIGEIPYQRLPLYSVSCDYFFQRLSKGSPLYDAKTLTTYVEDDLQIIDAFKPDFIIGDFRLSLAISSRLRKIPYATISNAYWSPYSNIHYTVPDIPLTGFLGASKAQKLFDVIRPIVFAAHTLAFKKVCNKYAIPIHSYDMRKIYTQADYTLYADMETLIPMKAYPDNHLFIGPVLWSAKIPLPDWWQTLPDDKAIIFISMGSSGDGKILPFLLRVLSQMPVTIIAVTANNSIVQQRYNNAFISTFLPAETAIKKSDIVICNGGSPMAYQALSENKKLIGIPSNLDQYLMMTAIKDAGLGEYIRAGELSAEQLQSMVHQVLATIKNTSETQSNITHNSINAVNIIDQLIQSACQ